jgi:hypothetical protein
MRLSETRHIRMGLGVRNACHGLERLGFGVPQKQRGHPMRLTVDACNVEEQSNVRLPV